jgi:hypothetical protein
VRSRATPSAIANAIMPSILPVEGFLESTLLDSSCGSELVAELYLEPTSPGGFSAEVDRLP